VQARRSNYFDRAEIHKRDVAMNLSEYDDEDIIEEVKHRGLIICTDKNHEETINAAEELITELNKQFKRFPEWKEVL